MNATEYFRNVKVCQKIRSSKCRDGRKRSSPSSFCALSLQCYKISEENDVHICLHLLLYYLGMSNHMSFYAIFVENLVKEHGRIKSYFEKLHYFMI